MKPPTGIRIPIMALCAMLFIISLVTLALAQNDTAEQVDAGVHLSRGSIRPLRPVERTFRIDRATAGLLLQTHRG